LVGLMFYEGQIAGTADAGRSARQAVVRALQRASMTELAERRAAVIAAVREVAELEFVNGGGTGSFESSAVEGTLTELAAGSGLFDGVHGRLHRGGGGRGRPSADHRVAAGARVFGSRGSRGGADAADRARNQGPAHRRPRVVPSCEGRGTGRTLQRIPRREG